MALLYWRNIQKFHLTLRFLNTYKITLTRVWIYKKKSRTKVHERTSIKLVKKISQKKKKKKKVDNYLGWLAVTCLSSLRKSGSRRYTLVSRICCNIFALLESEIENSTKKIWKKEKNGEWYSTTWYKSSLCNKPLEGLVTFFAFCSIASNKGLG